MYGSCITAAVVIYVCKLKSCFLASPACGPSLDAVPNVVVRNICPKFLLFIRFKDVTVVTRNSTTVF